MPEDVDPLAGRVLGDYRVGARLGAGAMGEVYRASHVRLDREVALKVLRAAGEVHPDLAARFQREGELQGRLVHAGLVRVFDVGATEGVRWIAMELVSGSTLAHYIDRSAPHPLDFLVPAGQVMAGALACLHAARIVHRDLKPPNVLIGDDGLAQRDLASLVISASPAPRPARS